MGREKSIMSADAVTLSGNLGDALQRHAHERAERFFAFMLYLDAVCEYATKRGVAVKPMEVMQVTATHQVHEGLYSSNPAYTKFDAKDPNVVNVPATWFSMVDAAHFCNLGIEAGALSKLAALGTRDAGAQELLTGLIDFARATGQLPKQVNVGPDKKIDHMHGRYAETMLKAGRPLMTQSNVKGYLAEATRILGVYRAEKLGQKKLGLAACADAYLKTYAQGPHRLWAGIMSETVALCGLTGHHGFKLDDYLSWT